MILFVLYYAFSAAGFLIGRSSEPIPPIPPISPPNASESPDSSEADPLSLSQLSLDLLEAQYVSHRCAYRAIRPLLPRCQNAGFDEVEPREHVLAALQLSLCEFRAAGVAVPPQCEPIESIQPQETPQIGNSALNDQITSCMRHIESSGQKWTSFSGNYRNVATICKQEAAGLEKEQLLEFYRNVSAFHRQTFREFSEDAEARRDELERKMAQRYREFVAEGAEEMKEFTQSLVAELNAEADLWRSNVAQMSDEAIKEIVAQLTTASELLVADLTEKITYSTNYVAKEVSEVLVAQLKTEQETIEAQREAFINRVWDTLDTEVSAEVAQALRGRLEEEILDILAVAHNLVAQLNAETAQTAAFAASLHSQLSFLNGTLVASVQPVVAQVGRMELWQPLYVWLKSLPPQGRLIIVILTTRVAYRVIVALLSPQLYWKVAQCVAQQLLGIRWRHQQPQQPGQVPNGETHVAFNYATVAMLSSSATALLVAYLHPQGWGGTTESGVTSVAQPSATGD